MAFGRCPHLILWSLLQINTEKYKEHSPFTSYSQLTPFDVHSLDIKREKLMSKLKIIKQFTITSAVENLMLIQIISKYIQI